MNTMTCKRVEARLAEMLAEPEKSPPPEIARHLVECGHCRELWQSLRLGLDAAQRAEPPPASALLVERQTARALSQAAEKRPRIWPLVWAGALTAGAAAAVLVAAVWVMRPSPLALEITSGAIIASDHTYLGGETLAVKADGDLAGRTEQPAELRLADASQVSLAAATEFHFHPGRSWRLGLSRGSATLKVTPRRHRDVQVVTAEAVVLVRGTRFKVTRADEVTTIELFDGTLEVRPTSGTATSQLSAPSSLRVGPAGVLPPPSVTPSPAPPDSMATDGDNHADRRKGARSRPTVRPPNSQRSDVDVDSIRSRIRAGRIREAQELIEAARSQAGVGEEMLAEIEMLTAEVYVAQGRYRDAVAVYVTVASRYPRQFQAQASLIAAAQLAQDKLDDKDLARTLARRCLDRYPEGALTPEARQLSE